MANYKTIKQLRDYWIDPNHGNDVIREAIEAALRLGAATEHRAIESHIMRSDYSNVTGDIAGSRIINFIYGRRNRTEKAAGGLGKPKKAVKKKK